MVKMLTVLVSTISNSQALLLSSFCKSFSQFFIKIISKYAIFNDQSVNDTLTNDIFSFEQLGRDIYKISLTVHVFSYEMIHIIRKDHS